MQGRGGWIGGILGEHLDQSAATDLLTDQPFRGQDQAKPGACGGNEHLPVIGEERTRRPDLRRRLAIAEPPRIAAGMAAKGEARMTREVVRPQRVTRPLQV